jgi:hypothetical protein
MFGCKVLKTKDLAVWHGYCLPVSVANKGVKYYGTPIATYRSGCGVSQSRQVRRGYLPVAGLDMILTQSLNCIQVVQYICQ